MAEIRLYRPQDVVLWSGAGLSMDGPASLPSGAELTHRVFGSFFAPGTLERVLTRHAALGLTQPDACTLDTRLPSPRLPRLETALDVVGRARLGPQALREVLADVRTAAPNRLHAFAAEHLARGGNHLTANFDACIERAYAERYHEPPPPGALHHFHGSFARSPDGRELGATLSRIQPGFPERERRAVERLLPADGLLLVVGYGGGDYFDIDPLLAALTPGRLRGLRVVWVTHGTGHPPHAWSEPADFTVPAQRLLHRAGAQVTVVCGRTGLVLDNLAEQWRLPDLGDDAPREVGAPRPAVGEAERQRATFCLYQALGMHREVRLLLESGRTGTADAAVVRRAWSEVLWEEGAWNTVRGLWRAAPRAGAAGVERAERIGAALWAQGRLVPAYVWLSWHLARAPGTPSRGALAETRGRVLEHMARTPELRPLARLLLRPTLASLAVEQASGAPSRTHADLLDSLHALQDRRPRDASHAERSVEWFRESGNLQGMLSYRQRMLRDRYRPSVPAVVLRREYEELTAANLLLGSPAGAWRTVLLPGAARVYDVVEFLSALALLQYGWWHRVRLLAWYLPNRLRHLLRGRTVRR